MLAVDPARVVEGQARIANPPAVAVVAAWLVAGRVVAGRERRRAVIGASDRVVDPPSRQDLLGADSALVAEQLPEPGDVSQRGADPAVSHRVAVRVERDIGVELGTDRPP